MAASLRLLVCILTAMLLPGSPLGIAQAVNELPRPTDYVSDFAHVLSPSVTEQLDLLCGQVDHKAHAQIAVVTVTTTNDEPISEYAVELEDAWKVGPKGSDRGVIVLLSVKDHKRFISTGYGVESILPDGKVGEIGRGMVPALKEGNYDAALGGAVGQIAQVIAADAGVTLETPAARTRRPQPQPVHLSIGQLLVGGFVLLFLLFIAARTGLLPFLFGMFLGSSFGGRRGGGFGGDGDGGDGGGDGFDGFGGGSTGGGGAGGDW